MSLYRVFIARQTSDGRFVVFERLEGEVNSVVIEMALEGRSGEYSSWLLSRGGGLDVSGSLSDADIGSLLLARELGEWMDISSTVQTSERNRDLFLPQNRFHVGETQQNSTCWKRADALHGRNKSSVLIIVAHTKLEGK
jgi:hypothetical protein